MAVEFRAVERAEIPELTRFLLDVFRMPAEAMFVRPDVIEWKYFSPHPLRGDARSYVLCKDGQYAAHGCLAPFEWAAGDRRVAAMQIIDWASGREIPGAGMLLYRNSLTLMDPLVAIGGSDDTRKLISMVKWFRELPPIRLFARPLRPWRQIAASRSGVKRDLARLGRSMAWSIWPWVPGAGGWTCRPVAQFARAVTGSGLVRSPEWLNYLLRYPAAQMSALEIYEGELWRGQALLSNVNGQVRIVDLCVDAGGEQALRAVYRYVRGQSDALEIVGGSTVPSVCSAFERCGFHARGTVPVYLADPKKKVAADAELELNLALGDAFYQFDPARPFWT